MTVKALVSFSTVSFSMYQGETREVADKDSLSDLLKANLIEEVKAKKGGAKNESKPNNSK